LPEKKSREEFEKLEKQLRKLDLLSKGSEFIGYNQVIDEIGEIDLNELIDEEKVIQIAKDIHGIKYLRDKTDESYSPQDSVRADVLETNIKALAKAIKSSDIWKEQK